MDLLLSLVCGALGGMAVTGLMTTPRLWLSVRAGLGLVGGWLGALALETFGIGLAHAPAPGGALDATALGVQIAVTSATGAALTAVMGYLRRLAGR